MSDLIVNPEIPYVGNTPSGNAIVGKLCRIQGVTLPQADRFNINLQTGPSSNPRDDTALHMSVRINQGYVARNTYVNGEWGDEEGLGDLRIGPAQSFEILILVDVHDYKIAINGQHFCEFAHRIPFEKVSHLLIDGDITITLISWENSIRPRQNEPTFEPSSSSTNLSHQATPGQYFPPNAYQPQGYFNGPPPPPPPGAQAEAGFGGFLEQAQEALMGAIKTGAAEKILSGLLSTDDKKGYPPQNANYGQYPPPQAPSSSETKGPLENFLTGILSSGTTQQQNPQPQTQMGNSGGFGNMGGFLSNIAGQLFQNPKGDNRMQQ